MDTMIAEHVFRGLDQKSKERLNEWLKKWVEFELNNLQNPYIAFTCVRGRKEAELKIGEKSRYYLRALEWAEYQGISIVEALFEDLEDDFKNCGGSFFHRIEDITNIYQTVDDTQKEEIVLRLVELLGYTFLGD